MSLDAMPSGTPKKKPPRKAVLVVEVLVLSLGLNPTTDVPG